jgi:muconolactone delta-isomerase
MKYMVQGTMRQSQTAETMALIPAEVAAGAALDQRGIRAALYVAADFSTAWQVFDADSEAEVREALSTLPLTPYTEYRITPLAGAPPSGMPGA